MKEPEKFTDDELALLYDVVGRTSGSLGWKLYKKLERIIEARGEKRQKLIEARSRLIAQVNGYNAAKSALEAAQMVVKELEAE